jgi:hypothetical protein
LPPLPRPVILNSSVQSELTGKNDASPKYSFVFILNSQRLYLVAWIT